MIKEIEAAVDLLTSYLPTYEQEHFKHNLSTKLQQRYTGHWFPDEPLRGSGYRALNVIDGRADAEIAACVQSKDSLVFLPADIVVWVDPNTVAFRKGDFGFVSCCYENRPKLLIRSPEKPIEIKKRINRPLSPPARFQPTQLVKSVVAN